MAAAAPRVTLPTDDPGALRPAPLKWRVPSRPTSSRSTTRGRRGSAAGTTSDARRSFSTRAPGIPRTRRVDPKLESAHPRAHAPARTLGTLGTALTTATSKTEGTNKNTTEKMADPNDRDSFRAATRRRFVDDMLGKVQEASPQSEWRVMIVDDVTVRVVSSTCGMSDLTAGGISLVETLGKPREPQGHLEAVYFLTPSAESVGKLCDDWAKPMTKKKKDDAPTSMYLKAHVFFSSPLPSAQLLQIKKCKPLVESLVSLAELNLEYQTRDQRTFVTGQEYALVDFFGGKSPKDKPEWRREVDVCATR